MLYWLVAGLLALGLGILLTPEQLIGLGIMDRSLLSENEMVRAVAHFEVALVKYASLVVGFLFVLIALLWRRLNETQIFNLFVANTGSYSPVYERVISRLLTAESVVLFLIVCLSLLYLGYGDTLFSLATLRKIGREDGLLEAGSAMLLLVAAILCVVVCLSKSPRSSSRSMHAFLAILFFVMAGEEISWGQRYLGIETSEAISKINVQNEINFHNMFGYFFDHLFIFCFFVWGCVVPVLYRTSRLFRSIFRRIGLPIPGLGILCSMFIATTMQDQILEIFGLSVQSLRPAELREFISASAFVAIASQSIRGLVMQANAEVDSSNYNSLEKVGGA